MGGKRSCVVCMDRDASVALGAHGATFGPCLCAVCLQAMKNEKTNPSTNWDLTVEEERSSFVEGPVQDVIDATRQEVQT